ncbi:MAG: GNAT family N-acetyltransferase [Candidatus Limnocylindrales bacterium]
MQARRGELVDVLEGGTGLVAEVDEAPVGVITWLLERGGLSVEIRAVAVDGASRGRGIGRALFEAAHRALAAADAGSSWLVTTNDNVSAIHLYQALGYAVVEIRRGAIDEIRRTIKPSIPLVGDGGTEMHDELEMRRPLETYSVTLRRGRRSQGP